MINGGTMSNELKAGAVLFAQDLPRVARFYAELVPMAVALSELLFQPICTPAAPGGTRNDAGLPRRRRSERTRRR